MKYQAVLFDLDGTLLDTIEDLADSVNRVLERAGFAKHSVDVYKYFVGEGLQELVRRALPQDHRSEGELTDYFRAVSEEYKKCWMKKTRLYAGIADMLTSLTQKAVKTAVLSNKPDAFARIMIERILADWKFEIVVGAKDSVPRKPDPSAALKIAEEFRILPERFLYVGDTHTDMKTATAAGMFPVGALWGFRTRDELLDSGAKVLLEKPEDLLKLL